MSTPYPLFHDHSSQIAVDEAFGIFLQYTQDKNITLYPAQEEAILEIFNDNNVILNTPTGSGKSLVATATHYYSLIRGRRSFYTSPVKALVNEKFFSLCRDFGPERVGLTTGDARVNHEAPIICCTAEILANIALREGTQASIDDAILDEFHYYSDRERGTAWQVPLLILKKTRFLLMSATFGSTDHLKKTLTDLNSKKTIIVSSTTRPVPLSFKYSETPLEETVQDLIQENKAPIYIVSFTQRECAERAQSFLSLNFTSKEEKKVLSKALQNYSYSSPYGKEMHKYLRHGIGLHHGGILPKYRMLVEQLAQKALLKIICGTDTLGVGVNIPIRTVLLTKLCKFDGKKTTILSIRDFHQICGRAGRKGFDDQGDIVVQAPAHVIENKKLEAKAKLNPKLKKRPKARAPEKNFVPWNKDLFETMRTSAPEALKSSFQISHSLILNVLSRDGNGFTNLKHILKKCHETPASKKHIRKKFFQIFRSLKDKKIIEIIPQHERLDSPVRINLSLQDDFSINETLALYFLDTLKFIDPMSENYGLKILSLAEAIVENPQPILYKQLDKIKKEKLALMKEEGVDYEERIIELDKLEYPKPMRDFIYDQYNIFIEKHPWITEENVKPKSIARQMYETFQTFSEYTREFGIQKSEGLLLRHLSNVYKVLKQTLPEHARNDETDEITIFIKNTIKSTDSSMLDEWERLKHPEALFENKSLSSQEDSKDDFTKNKKEYHNTIRDSIYRFVKSLADQDWEIAFSFIDSHTDEEQEWSIPVLENKMKTYLEEHESVCLNLEARRQHNIIIQDTPGGKIAEVILIDPKNHNDWSIKLYIDTKKSKKEQKPTLNFISMDTIGLH